MILLDLISIIVQLAFGWLLADFLSGLFHWIEDRFGPGREHWPVLGRLIFRPNLAHHDDPTLFLEAGFIGRNWTTWAVVAPLAAVLFWLFGSQVWIWTAAVGGAFANEVHAWAHRKTWAPKWAHKLQGWGVIQSPKHHAVHHVPPYARNYCIISDWLNPVLDGLRFWSLIESAMPKGWFRK